MSFEFETNNIVYEINNQLQSNTKKIQFSGIWINRHENENCTNNEYLEQTKHSNDCLRHWRFIKQFRSKEKAVKFLKNKVIIDGKHACEEEIHNELKKYTYISR